MASDLQCSESSLFAWALQCKEQHYRRALQSTRRRERIKKYAEQPEEELARESTKESAEWALACWKFRYAKHISAIAECGQLKVWRWAE